MEGTQVEFCYQTAEASHTDNYLWEKVCQILKTHPSGKLFEIGCGNGFTANRLANLGYDVTAVDPSRSGIAMGRQEYLNLKLFEGSAYDDLAGKYGQFPVVISLEVIEHCYDPRKYARTFYELLEPGGLGIISTPYHGYLKNLALAVTGKLDRHFTVLWDGGHIKFFSPATLTQLLLEIGFEAPEIFRVGRIPPLAKSMIALFKRPLAGQDSADDDRMAD